MVAKALPRGRTFTGDRTNASIDQSRDSLAQALANIPFLSGRLVKDVSILAAATLITHNLGRKMKGFIVVNCTQSPNELPAYSSDGEDPARQVYLTTTTNSFIGDIWFF